ncbi:OmpH family outer membrane protein [Chitinophaga sp.]|uniref:OmpH family outer membrane protein n=1 Tax=Chitinophaga sp. TaxID=1869181 RepID=UPI0031DAFADE
MRKKFTFVILLLCITAFFSSTSFAQAKIAYVNMQQLVVSMPEARKAYDSLQQYQQELLKDGQALVAAYQARASEFDSTQEKLSPAIREVKMKELELAKNNIEEYRQKMEQQLSDREQKLTAPILARAKKAIADLAAEKGYVCVLDNSKDIVVTATCEDLMPAAKQKLGIK